jgi:hypothetical protein
LRSLAQGRPFFGASFNELGALRNIQAAILLPLSCACFLTGSRKRLSWGTESLMPITKLPEMVACAGAVSVSSGARAGDPVLTVTLNTEEGDRYMLPLSERAITQLTEVITGWRRTRDFPDQQELSLQ